MAGKLVLHIGSTKTGTSAIQSALTRNRDALLARGVMVPPGRSDEKAAEGRVTGGNGWMLHVFKSRFQKQPPVAVKRLNARLQQVVADTTCDTAIFSSEALGGYDAATLSELKSIAEQYFDRVQIVYFVRHLTDHAISRYGEYVKRRGMTKTFPEFASTYEAPFKAALETYETVFGREAMTCHLYEDVRDRIFETFLETIDVSIDGVEIPKSVNRSLTADEIEVFRMINAKNYDRVQIAKIIEDFTFNTPKSGRRYPDIPKASIAAIEKNHEEDLVFVNERLPGPSRLRVASDEILAIASDTDETVKTVRDPDILLGVLESTLRMSDIRVEEMKAKLKKSEAARRKAAKTKAARRRAVRAKAAIPKTLSAALKSRIKQLLGGGKA